MERRPLGAIDPNSVREAEAHTDSRRRQSHGEPDLLRSPQVDRERAAARRRETARRARETDGARAERCVRDCRLPNSNTQRRLFFFYRKKRKTNCTRYDVQRKWRHTYLAPSTHDTLGTQHTQPNTADTDIRTPLHTHSGLGRTERDKPSDGNTTTTTATSQPRKRSCMASAAAAFCEAAAGDNTSERGEVCAHVSRRGVCAYVAVCFRGAVYMH